MFVPKAELVCWDQIILFLTVFILISSVVSNRLDNAESNEIGFYKEARCIGSPDSRIRITSATFQRSGTFFSKKAIFLF